MLTLFRDNRDTYWEARKTRGDRRDGHVDGQYRLRDEEDRSCGRRLSSILNTLILPNKLQGFCAVTSRR